MRPPPPKSKKIARERIFVLFQRAREFFPEDPLIGIPAAVLPALSPVPRRRAESPGADRTRKGDDDLPLLRETDAGSPGGET